MTSSQDVNARIPSPLCIPIPCMIATRHINPSLSLHNHLSPSHSRYSTLYENKLCICGTSAFINELPRQIYCSDDSYLFIP